MVSFSKWFTLRNPFVKDITVVNYGIAKHILELIDSVIDISPDAKAKEIHVHLNNKRKEHQILKKRNELSLLRNPNFLPTKCHNPMYIFPASLLPTLPQVNIFFFSLLQ